MTLYQSQLEVTFQNLTWTEFGGTLYHDATPAHIESFEMARRWESCGAKVRHLEPKLHDSETQHVVDKRMVDAVMVVETN